MRARWRRKAAASPLGRPVFSLQTAHANTRGRDRPRWLSPVSHAVKVRPWLRRPDRWPCARGTGVRRESPYLTRSHTSVATISLSMNGLTNGVVFHWSRSPWISNRRVCSMPFHAWFHETSGTMMSLFPSVRYVPAYATIVR